MKWVIAIALLLLLLLQGCDTPAPRVFGTVERDRLTLIAPVNETLTAIEVKEGDRVTAGQVLLRLDPTGAKAVLAQRQAQRDQAQSILNELIAGARTEAIGRAQAKLAGTNASVKEAKQIFVRTERLFATKVLTQADLDRARAARDAALASQTEAMQGLEELENGTRSEQLDQARASVVAAQAAVAFAQKSLQDLTLVAAQDAIVDNLPWRIGDRVSAGTQLIGLSAVARPYVRVYLPSTWLDKVRDGSLVKIFVDGRDVAIQGKVRHIRSRPAYTPFYALNERDRARLMYLTDIDISPEQDLPMGMILEVELP